MDGKTWSNQTVPRNYQKIIIEKERKQDYLDLDDSFVASSCEDIDSIDNLTKE